jgi:hypothetical protein
MHGEIYMEKSGGEQMAPIWIAKAFITIGLTGDCTRSNQSYIPDAPIVIKAFALQIGAIPLQTSPHRSRRAFLSVAISDCLPCRVSPSGYSSNFSQSLQARSSISFGHQRRRNSERRAHKSWEEFGSSSNRILFSCEIRL